MMIKLASIVLRVCGILALILGLLFWTGNALNFIGLHMLLGLLVVVSLWVIGLGQAFSRSRNWPIAIAALVVGALVIFVGMAQSRLIPGPFHWVIEVLHLLLGVLAVGIGQISATRYRQPMARSATP